MWEIISKKTFFGECTFWWQIESRILEGDRPPIPSLPHGSCFSHFLSKFSIVNFLLSFSLTGQEDYKKLIEECWSQRITNRPSFHLIYVRLQSLLNPLGSLLLPDTSPPARRFPPLSTSPSISPALSPSPFSCTPPSSLSLSPLSTPSTPQSRCSQCHSVVNCVNCLKPLPPSSSPSSPCRFTPSHGGPLACPSPSSLSSLSSPSSARRHTPVPPVMSTLQNSLPTPFPTPSPSCSSSSFFYSSSSIPSTTSSSSRPNKKKDTNSACETEVSLSPSRPQSPLSKMKRGHNALTREDLKILREVREEQKRQKEKDERVEKDEKDEKEEREEREERKEKKEKRKKEKGKTPRKTERELLLEREIEELKAEVQRLQSKLEQQEKKKTRGAKR